MTKPKYSIKLKKIKRRYVVSWEPFINEVKNKRRAIQLIKSEIVRIKNTRRHNKKGKEGFKQMFIYGLFSDNHLVKEFKI